MEYLPEKKRNLHMLLEEKKEKMAKFREYIADNDVVQIFVKFLLSIRKETPWNEDPMQYLHDYFGNYRDPSWDQFEDIQRENEELTAKIPEIEAKIEQIQLDIKIAKKLTQAYETFKPFDIDGSGIAGTKFMISKLSGNNKFDTDTKMNKRQFYYLILHFLGEDAENEERFNKFLSYFHRAMKDTTPPFTGDLDNPDYITIQEKMRSFRPPEVNEHGELVGENA